MENEYPNEVLAKDYLEVVGLRYCDNRKSFIEQKGRIRSIETSLKNLYKETGNLNPMAEKGLKKITRRVLELLIEHGFEDTKNLLLEERTKIMGEETPRLARPTTRPHEAVMYNDMWWDLI